MTRNLNDDDIQNVSGGGRVAGTDDKDPSDGTNPVHPNSDNPVNVGGGGSEPSLGEAGDDSGGPQQP